MFNSMKSLLLASVLSLTAASAALAGGAHGLGGDFHSGASAAPICDGTGRTQKTANDGRLSRDRCRVIAVDGGPSSAGDNNGHSDKMATDGPGSPTDGTGRSQASNTTSGERHPILASSKPSSGGNINI